MWNGIRKAAARVVLATGAIALTFVGSAAAAVTPEARPLLAKLEKAIEPLKSFEATFIQVRHLALTDEKVEATGRLRFLAPDGFRLDYKSPDADVLSMSGDSLIVYFQALKQAQRYRVDEDEATRNMFLLFSARHGVLENRFDISLSEGPEGPALRFQPLEDAIDYPLTEIRAHLNSKTGLPERLFFNEEGGDTILFRLANPRLNQKLTPRDFVFVPPRGTEIITR
jgi:outer membrane lipoprotein-sorting protein